MLKISFVILLICCLAATQIKAQTPAKCSIEEKLEGCQCVRVSILNSSQKLEWCPPRYTMRDDGECERIFRSQAKCEEFQSPNMGVDGCVCL